VNMKDLKTSNIQHPTPDIQGDEVKLLFGCWMLVVGCSMFLSLT
jgi:hypothetical protein